MCTTRRLLWILGVTLYPALAHAVEPEIDVTDAIPIEPMRIPTQVMGVAVDSGLVEVPARHRGPGLAYSHVVSVPGASSLRLHFDKVRLAEARRRNEEPYIRITSLSDGGVQILDAKSLEQWNNTTAYFNGDSVLVEVVGFAGAGKHRISIDQIAAGMTPMDEGCEQGGVAAVCAGQTDDRVPSSDPRAGRIRFPMQTTDCCQSSCTGFLFDDRANSLLTAGHCCDYFDFECVFKPIVEFDVPLSDSDGSINASAPQDQYPIDKESVQFLNTGQGGDWCYFGVWRNNSTGMCPLAAQGDSYTLPSSIVFYSDNTTRLTGFGADSGQDNLTEQTHAGPWGGESYPYFTYYVDSAGGCSGGAAEHLAADRVYGITTHRHCGTNPGYVIATFITRADLQAAINNPTGVTADCNENGIPAGCEAQNSQTYEYGACCISTGWMTYTCVHLPNCICEERGGTFAGFKTKCQFVNCSSLPEE